jgi:hypothetical protein
VLAALRRAALRRLTLLLVLLSFLPVASAMAACQLACALHGATGPHDAAHAPGASHAAHGSGATPHGAQLAHAGPCHLAAVPAMAAAPPRSVIVDPAIDWPPTPAGRHDSHVWPPPEPRPRA